jgi:glycosyltransferase involved in cell wall biosynthesis
VKLLIHDYAGHPFQVQLSRALARRGHTVHHIYAASIQTPRGALARKHDDPASLTIEGVALSEQFQKQSFLKRRSQELEYGRALARRVEELLPDRLISGNTPSEPQALLLRTCRRIGIPFVSWVQDFYGIAVHRLLRKRLPVAGSLVGWYYRGLDRWILRHSDRIVLITEDFRPLVTRMGVPHERVRVIENWAPLDELPEKPRDNPWAREHGLADKFVFLYSGTLGMKHNPALLTELASTFRNDPAVRVVVISEGPGADWLEERRTRDGLDNLSVLSFQPFESMPEVLGSADVLVAILEPDAGQFSVPSKVLTYLCAGRALLAAMPAENLAARIIRRTKSGFVAAPNDGNTFASLARQLRTNEMERRAAGASAREYAARSFSIAHVTSRFEEVFDVHPDESRLPST